MMTPAETLYHDSIHGLVSQYGLSSMCNPGGREFYVKDCPQFGHCQINEMPGSDQEDYEIVRAWCDKHREGLLERVYNPPVGLYHRIQGNKVIITQVKQL